MTLSEELTWRGFLEQTTFKDITDIDSGGISFYWGVDPSADSMTIGNLATTMMIKHFMKAGHKAVLVVGGATGQIGDPDGKSSERQLISLELLASNKRKIVDQYNQLFTGESFDVVDNFDWFKDMHYLTFLRDVGKNVPTRQMLARDFVSSRLSEKGGGISYAEFSYVIIQAYDFLRLYEDRNVTLQLAGSDQWGNCIAGIDLIRRLSNGTANVWTAPLIVDPVTGQKFGKSEAGAVWLDPKKTTPTAFYQFWINSDDSVVEQYLKIYTLLNKEEIETLVKEHKTDPSKRLAQKKLAEEVTKLVHGKEAANLAQSVTGYLTGESSIDKAIPNELIAIRKEIPSVKVKIGDPLIDTLVKSGLCSSNSEAKTLLHSQAIYINGRATEQTVLNTGDFKGGRLLIRRGKAFKDSALFEL